MRFDVPSDVINKLFENGYENQILDIVMLFEDDNNREVSDIPLSPTIMKDNGKNIINTSKNGTEYICLSEEKLAEFIKFIAKDVNNEANSIIKNNKSYKNRDDISGGEIRSFFNNIEQKILDSTTIRFTDGKLQYILPLLVFLLY